MVRRVGAAARTVALAALLLACSGEADETGAVGFSPDPERAHRVAWLGTCADGAPLVVEALAPAHHPELAVVQEEKRLRELFRLSETATILRVHACGGTAGSAPGSVETPDGSLLQPLGHPPEELSAAERLMWYAVAQDGSEHWSGPVPGERRSYLVVGEDIARERHASLTWIHGGERSTLERREWTERERREYLDTSFPASAGEAEVAAHAPQEDE